MNKRIPPKKIIGIPIINPITVKEDNMPRITNSNPKNFRLGFTTIATTNTSTPDTIIPVLVESLAESLVE